MTIHFMQDFDDLIALQKNVIEDSYTHYIKKLYFKWITTILLAILVLVVVNTSLLTVLIALALAVIYYFLAPTLYNQLAFSKLKRQMQQKDYAHLLGACQMTFSEGGITRVIQDNETYFNWNRFEKIGEDDKHYFLYESDLQGLIIPKEWHNMDGGQHHTLKKLIQKAKK